MVLLVPTTRLHSITYRISVRIYPIPLCRVLDVAESPGTRGLTFTDDLRRTAILVCSARAGAFALLYLASSLKPNVKASLLLPLARDGE